MIYNIYDKKSIKKNICDGIEKLRLDLFILKNLNILSTTIKRKIFQYKTIFGNNFTHQTFNA